jgi:hypothetical protein
MTDNCSRREANSSFIIHHLSFYLFIILTPEAYG